MADTLLSASWNTLTNAAVSPAAGFLGYRPTENIGSELITLLRGAKPADVPVEQPIKVDFVCSK